MTTIPTIADRPPMSGPSRGGTGLTPTLVRIELRRMVRNRRTMIFALVFPVLMLLVVNASIPQDQRSMGATVVANVGAYLAVSMALYGSIIASTTGGAAVAVDRASGWSRQLRLTPLRASAYIAAKVLSAFVLGALALAATFTAARLFGQATMSGQTWLEAGLIVMAGSPVFAALGVFLGYLFRSDNVMQITGPMIALLGFLGGLFQGPVDTSTTMGKIQSFTPIYGLSQLAHWPLTLTTAGGHGPFSWWWVVNLGAWGLLFALGAIWRYTKDTARV